MVPLASGLALAWNLLRGKSRRLSSRRRSPNSTRYLRQHWTSHHRSRRSHSTYIGDRNHHSFGHSYSIRVYRNNYYYGNHGPDYRSPKPRPSFLRARSSRPLRTTRPLRPTRTAWLPRPPRLSSSPPMGSVSSSWTATSSTTYDGQDQSGQDQDFEDATSASASESL